MVTSIHVQLRLQPQLGAIRGRLVQYVIIIAAPDLEGKVFRGEEE